MPQRLLIIFFVFTFASTSFAQSDVKASFSILAGLNQTSISKSSDSNSSFRGTYSDLEWYAHFNTDLSFNEHWGGVIGIGIATADQTTFLELPIVLTYNFNEKWKVFLGSQGDFILNEASDTVYYKHAGLSGVLGIEYYIIPQIFIDLRTTRGIVEQIKIENQYGGKRSTFRLGIGYKF